MKTNSELQLDVQNAILWEPLLHAAEIGVTAKDGVISLTGVVDSYAKKKEAEAAAKRVKGVKAIVENIEVHFANSWQKSDFDIANTVLHAFKSNWTIPAEKIAVKVENGWVTLDGEVHWNYQREAAKNAVRFLTGVVGVIDQIKIKAEIKQELEKKDVENALERSWSIDTSNIQVAVSGTSVTLSGSVNSWFQKEEAERIAWNTPGIYHVYNELAVDYDYVLN